MTSCFLRGTRRLLFLSLLWIPWISHCSCESDIFDCQTSRDCTYLGLGSVCVGGTCRVDLTGSSCQTGDSRVCRRAGVSNRSNCYYGKQSCLNSTWSTCVLDSSRVQQEVCNGRDDNCDGSIDETFPELNQPCTVKDEKGPCAQGTIQGCRSGVLVCLSNTFSRPEGEAFGNCNNGIDDDCDGYIDDPVHDDCPSCTDGSQRDCYPYGLGMQDPTLNQGICRAGRQLCQNKKWQACQNAVTPQDEICGNQIDENCDGIVDNNCQQSDCQPGETRACYTGAVGTLGVGTCRSGQETCVSGKWGPCTGQILPRGEICGDQLDNDCNGKIDDCDPNACSVGDTRPCYSGSASTRGIGTCLAGIQSCAASGTWEAECKQEVLPTREICGNQKDDDCDGMVDNCQVLQLISGSWDRQASLVTWELSSGKIVQTFVQGHTDAVYATRFVPHGNTLISVGHDKQVIAWDADTGSISWQSTGSQSHTEPIYALAIHPNGKFVVTGSEDKTLRMWDVSTGAFLATTQANQGAIYAIDVDSSGSWLATGGEDGSVKLWQWSAQSLTLQHTLQGHSAEVYAVVFDPKGRWVISGSRDGVIRLWNLNGTTGPTLSYTNQSVTALAVDARTTKLAVGGADGSIAIFDITGTSPQLLKSWKETQKGAVYALAFHPMQNELAAGYYDHSLLRWDVLSGTVTHTWKGHNGPVSCLTYRP